MMPSFETTALDENYRLLFNAYGVFVQKRNRGRHKSRWRTLKRFDKTEDAVLYWMKADEPS